MTGFDAIAGDSYGVTVYGKLNPISWLFDGVFSVFSGDQISMNVNNWKCSTIITKITSRTETVNSLEAVCRGRRECEAGFS